MTYIPAWGNPSIDSISHTSNNVEVTLSWADTNYEPIYFKTEIYKSDTDDFQTAVSISTSVNNTHLDRDVVPGNTYYYWVQSYNFDDSPGDLFPIGAGYEVTVPFIEPTELNPFADVSSGSISASTHTAGFNTANPAPKDTWIDTGNYIEFTSTEQTAVFNVNITCSFTGNNIMGYSSPDSYGWVNSSLARIRLHDMTLGVDVPGHYWEHLIYSAVYTSSGWVELSAHDKIMNIPFVLQQGPLSVLNPGHTYRIILDVMRETTIGESILNWSISAIMARASISCTTL